MSAARVALRIGFRDALAHKLRSLLVILLVGLPVLVVTAGLVIGRTADTTAIERIPRDFGNAEAIVEPTTRGPVVQGIDHRYEGWYPVAVVRSWSEALESDGDEVSDVEGEGEEGGEEVPAPTLDDLRTVLGDDVEVTTLQTGSFGSRAGGERTWTRTLEFDFGTDITAPFYDLVSGAVPASEDEVLVNPAFADQFGVAVGDTLELQGLKATPRIVGLAESTDSFSPLLMGLPGTVIEEADGPPQWLVDSRPVSWADVKELNAMGFVATSRSVLLDPPAQGDLHPEMESVSWDGDDYDVAVAVTALVAVMVLLEVALLAGPALAVTARQQSRTLALVAAAGGTPRQARAVVVAQGAVLGLGAAVGAALLGVLVGVLALPLAQWFDTSVFGPLDIPWLWILGVVLVGAVAILSAAIVPAWITARQDPVRALAGRRADGNLHVGSPILGLALIVVGVLATVLSARGMGFPELGIAASTVIVVLGALLVTPVLVVLVARWGADWSLPFRFAARDAARHRGRTVPAIAAVAATVAGVVAVGITSQSQAAHQEANYTPQLPHGESAVTWRSDVVGDEEPVPASQMVRDVTAAARQLGLTPEAVYGLRAEYGDSYEQSWTFERPGLDEPIHVVGYQGWGVPVLVVDDTDLVSGLSGTERAQVQQELDAGHAVLLASSRYDSSAASQEKQEYDLVLSESQWAREGRTDELVRAESVPMAVRVVEREANVGLLVPTSLAARAELPVEQVALRFPGGLAKADAEDLEMLLGNLDERVAAQVTTEVGYEGDSEVALLLLLLVAGGAVLMLVGTLTATFLALSDARPDLATLGAVGASPRRRRSIGGAYALLIAGTGAVVGTLIGLVPGITAAYVTTGQYWDDGVVGGAHLEIPWVTVLVVLIGLPLLTAAVVWVSARARIPMVARID